MFKMGSCDSFEYLQHKLWPKEGLGVEVFNLILGH
jgi:hypothetical protein